MKTERLFDTDAFIFSFEAQVLSCEKQGKYYAAVLDKTAFFPEGGGQPADKGTLGGESVCDVQEREGIIYHYVKAPLGGTVQGVLDSNTRFCRMQNHSGEHVVSGIIHRLTGADNISFTLTDSETTLAFNVPLSEEMLAGVEREANDVVFRDVPISAYYPDSESLAALDYRSKLELSENVRLVEIAGTDLCACCAPHCRTTGQIGLIKIVASERYKGGTKLWIHCGSRALAHYALLLDEVTEISHLLCARADKIAPAVQKLKESKEQAEYTLVSLKRKAIEERIAGVPATEGNIVLRCDFQGDDLRLFAEGLKAKAGGFVLVCAGDDTSAYRFVLTAAQRDIMSLVQPANAALGGRGGGRDNMVRGTYAAPWQAIKQFFENQ